MNTASSMRRSKAFSLPNLLTYFRLAAIPAVVGFLFWPEDDVLGQIERFAQEVAPGVREAVSATR